MREDAALTVGGRSQDDLLRVLAHLWGQCGTHLCDQGRRDPGEHDVGDPRGEGLDEPVGDPRADQGRGLLQGRRRGGSHPGGELPDVLAKAGEAQREGCRAGVRAQGSDSAGDPRDLGAEHVQLLHAGGEPRQVGRERRDTSSGVSHVGQPLADLAQPSVSCGERRRQGRGASIEGLVQRRAGDGEGRGELGWADDGSAHQLLERVQPPGEGIDDGVAEPVGTRNLAQALDLGLQGVQSGREPVEGRRRARSQVVEGRTDLDEGGEPVVQARHVCLQGGQGGGEGRQRGDSPAQVDQGSTLIGDLCGQRHEAGRRCLDRYGGVGRRLLHPGGKAVESGPEQRSRRPQVRHDGGDLVGEPVDALLRGTAAYGVAEAGDQAAQLGKRCRDCPLLADLLLDRARQQGLHPVRDRIRGVVVH